MRSSSWLTRSIVTIARRSAATGACVREEQVDALLDRVAESVELGIMGNGLVDLGQIEGENRLAAALDRLQGQRPQPDHVEMETVEFLGEGPPDLRHDATRLPPPRFAVKPKLAGSSPPVHLRGALRQLLLRSLRAT